jgi:hypothetical protein
MGSDVLAEGLDCRSAFLDKPVLPGPCLLACSDMLVSANRAYGASQIVETRNCPFLATSVSLGVAKTNQAELITLV